MAYARKVNLVVVDEAARDRYNFLLDAAGLELLTVADLVQMVAGAAQDQQAARVAAGAPRRAVAGVPKKVARSITPQSGGAAAPFSYEYLAASMAGPTQGAGTAPTAAALSQGSFHLVSPSGEVLRATAVPLAKLNIAGGGTLEVTRQAPGAARAAPSAHDDPVAPPQPARTEPQPQPRQPHAMPTATQRAHPLGHRAFQADGNSSSSGSISFLDNSDDDSSSSSSLSSAVFESDSDSGTVSFPMGTTGTSHALLAPFAPQSVRSIEFFADTTTEGYSDDISFHTMATHDRRSSYIGASRTGHPATAAAAAAAAASPTARGALAAAGSASLTARSHYEQFMNRSRRREAQLQQAKLQQQQSKVGAAPAAARSSGVTLEHVLVAGRRATAKPYVVTPTPNDAPLGRTPAASQERAGTKKASKSKKKKSSNQKKKKSVRLSTEVQVMEEAEAAAKAAHSEQRKSSRAMITADTAPEPALSSGLLPEPCDATEAVAAELDLPAAEGEAGAEADVPQPPPVLTERELRLADMVQQLNEEVQRLLAQSHTDASRIAALRGALRDSQMNLRVVQEAHSNSLQQLGAVTESWTQPPVLSADSAAQEKPVPLGALHTETSMHTAVYADASDAAASGAPAQTETSAPEPEAVVAPPQPQPAEEEAEKEKGEADAEAPAAAVQGEGTHDGEAAPTAASSPSLSGDAEDVQLRNPSAPGSASAEPAPPPPVIAHFAELTAAELRNVVTQMGFLHHNRLLRRENALLMRQLRVANKASLQSSSSIMAVHTGRNSSGSNRLCVLVRVRPARLTAHASASARAYSGGDETARHPHHPHRDARAVEADAAVVEELRRLQASVKAADGDADGATSDASSALSSPRSFDSALNIEEHEDTAGDDKDNRGDVLLQCDAARSRLVVWSPAAAAASGCGGDLASGAEVREAAALRGVAVVGPPVPQCVATAVTHAAASSGAGGGAPTYHCASTTTRLAAAAQQRALFEDTVRPLVERMVRVGESGTVLAYGPASSGKTHTVFGNCGAGGRQHAAGGASRAPGAEELEDEVLPDAAGLVPRALRALLTELHDKAAGEELLLRSLYASRHDAAFHAGQARTRKAGAATGRAAALQALAEAPMYELQCTMVEVYGVEVRDLLAPKRTVLQEGGAAAAAATSTVHGAPVGSRAASGAAATTVRGASASATAAARPRAGLTTSPRSHAGATAAAASGAKPSPSPERPEYVSVSPACTLKTRKDGTVKVVGAVSLAFRTLDDGLAIVRSGLANREVRGSHVVFTLTLKQQVWRLADPAAAATKTVKVAATHKKRQSQLGDTVGSPSSSTPTTSAPARTPASQPRTPVSARLSSSRRGSSFWAGAPPSKLLPTTSARARPTLKKRADEALTCAEKEAAAQEAAAQARAAAQAEAEAAAAAAAAEAAAAATTESEHALEDDRVVLTTNDATAATAAGLEAAEEREQAAYLGLRTVKTVTSRLVFVDLASAPRPREALATDEPETERQREDSATRKSLSALRSVTTALYGHPLARPSSTSSSDRVPFRAHTLTTLLREALTKSARCIVVGCVALSEAPMRAVLCCPASQACAAGTDHAAAAAEQQAHAMWSNTVRRFLAQRQQQLRLQQQQLLEYSPQTPSSLAPAAFGATDAPPYGKDKAVSRSKKGTGRFGASKATTATNTSTHLAPFSARTSAQRRGDSVTSASLHQSRASQGRLEEFTAASGQPSAAGSVERRRSANGLSASHISASAAASSAAVLATHDHGVASARTTASPKDAADAMGAAPHQPQSELHSMKSWQSPVGEVLEELQAIQAATDVEEAAAAHALWIAPRDTLATFVFLGRLWKV